MGGSIARSDWVPAERVAIVGPSEALPTRLPVARRLSLSVRPFARSPFRPIALSAFRPLPPAPRGAGPTVVHFTYSRSPSRPPSRPNPLSRYPPNPLAASNTLVQLIQTVPAWSLGSTSSARLMFSVQRLAASP